MYSVDADSVGLARMMADARRPTGENFDYEELGKWILMKGTYPTNPSAKLSVTELHPNLYLVSTLGDRQVVQGAQCQSFFLSRRRSRRRSSSIARRCRR